jgi:hypothetical protein
LLSIGLAASFKTDINIPYLGVPFGFLLVLFSLVFWKLDQRNRDLIKGAEEALKFFESKVNREDEVGVPHVAKRFMREAFDTQHKKEQRSWAFWRNHYSYSECFRAVLILFGAVGFVGAICSGLRLVGHQ